MADPVISGHPGRGTYRIIFDIREDEQLVRVLRIWHASRDAITAADLTE